MACSDQLIAAGDETLNKIRFNQTKARTLELETGTFCTYRP